MPVLFAGRIIQAIGGDAAWIVGFATIADVVGPDDTSRTLTTVSVFFMSGLLVGPLVSGILMQLIGYWPTWGTALAVLAIDVIMRCIMIDSPKGAGNIKSQSAIESLDGKTSKTKVEEDPEAASETSSLLPRPWTTDQHTQNDEDKASDEKPSGPSSLSFYKVILTNPHALIGMAFQATSALILVSFDATLPLHVARNFGWNTSQTSLMFLFLQMPTFILSPLTGWLRDRVGPRTPTGVGYLLTALFLWLLGTPGEDGLFWGSGERGQAVYMASLVGLGIARTLYAGSGVIEMTCKFPFPSAPSIHGNPIYTECVLSDAVKDLQGNNPHVFGPNGGFSKAYSLCNMSWTFGMLIGPVLLGSVNELAGYYYMNALVGKWFFIFYFFCTTTLLITILIIWNSSNNKLCVKSAGFHIYWEELIVRTCYDCINISNNNRVLDLIYIFLLVPACNTRPGIPEHFQWETPSRASLHRCLGHDEVMLLPLISSTSTSTTSDNPTLLNNQHIKYYLLIAMARAAIGKMSWEKYALRPVQNATPATLPVFLYGTAWKKDQTTDLVHQALRSGFRAVDTAAQPKHYREDLVGEGVRRAIKDGTVRREDLYVSLFSPLVADCT